MISTQTRRAAALAAGVALVGATFTAMPATAATGDLTLAPTTGALGNYNVFNTDDFALSVVEDEIAALPDAQIKEKLSYSFEMSTSAYTGLIISLPDAAANDSLDVTRFSSAGEEVTSATAVTLTGAGKDLYLDFAGGTKAGKIVLSNLDRGGMTSPADMKKITIVPVKTDSNTSSDQTGGDTSVATRGDHGDKDLAVTVTAWLDTDSDISDVEPEYSTGSQVINFYDPDTVSVISSIERMTATGFDGDGAGDTTPTLQDFHMDVAGQNASDVTGRMKFNKPVNYAQVDLDKWTVGTSGTVTTVTLRAIDERASGEAFNEADGNFEVLTASNGLPAEVNGELLFRLFTNQNMEVGKKVQVNFKHSDNAETSTYSSPQFTFVQNSVAATAVAADVEVAPTASSKAIDGGSSTTLSTGVSEFTYTAQAQTAGGVDVETANIPMVAIVQATSFLPSGEEISVNGSSTKITRANQAVYVSGLTNSDGKFSVTVSAATAATGTKYTVQFLTQDGTTANAGDVVPDTEITATYAAAKASAFAAVSSVSSAASPTLAFTVKDAFGEGVSTDEDGTQYSVELSAPNTDDLEQYGQVAADGTVSFTFDNWLSAGESELLTAKLYEGTSTNPATTAFTGDEATVTLYAPVGVNAVNLNRDEIVDMDIEYNDFITGKKDKVGPTSGTNSETVNGTVVDSNGAGIPGTPVTLTAEGVQFLSGTTYSIGSVDLVTDAAGAFTAEIWVQTKSSTGITLTATAGTATDTALIKSDLPASDETNRGNLVFSVDMPANVVVNTTYAVTATVTDVFGNPVDGATVKFDGFGSAQFNGLASTTRLTNRNGEAVAYLRSLKDIDGLSSVEISVTKVDHDGDGVEDITSIASVVADDVETTSWDESAWSNSVEAEVNFLASAADLPSSNQKVNAGSFKGYVAVYAKGYEGQRLSAKIGNDWVIVDPIVNNESADLARVTDFTGAGVDIAVRIYIDRVLIDTINLTTK